MSLLFALEYFEGPLPSVDRCDKHLLHPNARGHGAKELSMKGRNFIPLITAHEL
jgi:hypothetical protein